MRNRQGGVTDESLNKTNGSISIKPETFHEDREKNSRYSIKNNKELYTSTTPSSMSWIDNDVTKLTKVNTFIKYFYQNTNIKLLTKK